MLSLLIESWKDYPFPCVSHTDILIKYKRAFQHGFQINCDKILTKAKLLLYVQYKYKHNKTKFCTNLKMTFRP